MESETKDQNPGLQKASERDGGEGKGDKEGKKDKGSAGGGNSDGTTDFLNAMKEMHEKIDELAPRNTIYVKHKIGDTTTKLNVASTKRDPEGYCRCMAVFNITRNGSTIQKSHVSFDLCPWLGYPSWDEVCPILKSVGVEINYDPEERHDK